MDIDLEQMAIDSLPAHVLDRMGEFVTPKPAKKNERKTYKLLSVQDIMLRKPGQHLVKGLLPRQGIAAIYGPSGSGKSFLALDLLGATARGDEWFDHRTNPAPMIYICLEGSHGLAHRVEAYLAEVGNIPGMHIIDEPYRLVDMNDEAALLASIKKAGLDRAVIVIDTLAQATAGLDENKGEDMTRAIAACQRIQAETGGLVVLIHHTGKDATRGLRGHSSLIGALDAAIEVSGGADSPRKWISAKVKDGESGKEYPFDLRRVVLGHDDDGDEISSCVIKRVESAAVSVRRVKLPKGGNQKIIWDALGSLFRKAGSLPPKDAPSELPAGRPCILLADAIAQTRDRLVCDADQKTYRTKKAIEGLIAGGSIAHLDGFIWCK